MQKLRDIGDAVKKDVPIKSLFRELFPDLYRDHGNSFCPFHDDRSPSLSLSKGNRAHCFGACQKSYSVIDLYMKAKKCDFKTALKSLTDRLGMANNHDLATNAESPHTIVAVYQYHDEQGNVLFENVRFQPKDFRMRRPTSSGNHVWNLKHCRRVPYRLPQVMSSAEVWLCEGEKDADRVASLGFTATCFPLGAGKNRQQLIKAHQMDLPFTDKNVMILPDNDETGSAFVEGVAETLGRVSAAVKVLDLKTLWTELPEKGDVSDLIEHLGEESTRRALRSLADDTPPLQRPSVIEEDDLVQGQRGSAERKSRFQLLKDTFFLSGARVFLDQHGIPWVTVKQEEAFKNLKLESKAFDNYVFRLYVDKYGDAVHEETIKSLKRYLETCAKEKRDLSNRFASSETEVWIDSGNDSWDAFHVTAQGWGVEKCPSPLFYRKPHQQELPIPRRGRDLSALLPLLPIKRASDRLLFFVWLVTVPLAHISRPLIILTGPPGSGKTLCCEFVRSLLDPSSVGTVPLSKDHTEFVQMLNNQGMIMLDNVGTIPAWASDALCRAVDGAGVTKRKLHTDDEDITWFFRRTGIMSAIDRPVSATDILDRAICIEVERIPDIMRQDRGSLVKLFEEIRPELFESLLDTLSKALALKPAVRSDRLPRMGEWCLYGGAAAELLGFGRDQFIAAYRCKIKDQSEQSLDWDVVALIVRSFVDREPRWEGSVSQLHAILSETALRSGVSAEWPKAPHVFSGKLRKISHKLAALGIRITFGRTKYHNTVSLQLLSPAVAEQALPASSPGLPPEIAPPGTGTLVESSISLRQGSIITSTHNLSQSRGNGGGGPGGESFRIDQSCPAHGGGCRDSVASRRDAVCSATHEEPGATCDPEAKCPIIGVAR
jgi:5S rRNA maturation endonuclease (ribonuclease M5)